MRRTLTVAATSVSVEAPPKEPTIVAAKRLSNDRAKAAQMQDTNINEQEIMKTGRLPK